jgi:hypothetical protein
LNCDGWLQEDPSYQHLAEDLDHLLGLALSKVQRQLAAIEPVLHEFWTYS